LQPLQVLEAVAVELFKVLEYLVAQVVVVEQALDLEQMERLDRETVVEMVETVAASHLEEAAEVEHRQLDQQE
jgi:hypothetical protein